MMIQVLFSQFSIFDQQRYVHIMGKYRYFFTPKSINSLKLWIENNRYDDSGTLFSTFDLRSTTYNGEISALFHLKIHEFVKTLDKDNHDDDSGTLFSTFDHVINTLLSIFYHQSTTI